MSNVELLGLGSRLNQQDPSVHLALVTVVSVNLGAPHEMLVSVDGQGTSTVPALCLAPYASKVWMLGRGSQAVILGPARWIDYTPTVSQGATSDIAKTVNYSRFLVEGYKVTYTWNLQITGAGTAGSLVLLSLPIPAKAVQATEGIAHIFDASTATRYILEAEGSTVSKIAFVHDTSGANGWGGNPNIAFAASDLISGTVTYEIA